MKKKQSVLHVIGGDNQILGITNFPGTSIDKIFHRNSMLDEVRD